MTERVLAVGVDGARGGWLAAVAFGRGEVVSRVELSLAIDFDDLHALRQGSDAPVAVDIPMGLLDSVAQRPCDRLARARLGPRASSVFLPPSRPLLDASTYADARALIEEERVGAPLAKGLSAQAFGIVPKIKQADDYLRANPGAQDWLYECHPELSFNVLAGRSLASKASVAGQADRIALLQGPFPDLLETLAAFAEPAKTAKLDDALDAYACLFTALRLRTPGAAEVLGDERDAAGLIMRIVA